MKLVFIFPFLVSVSFCLAPLHAANSLEVEYWAENEPLELDPASGGLRGAKSYRLESLPLVIDLPATLEVGGATYAIEREGLYRVKDSSRKVIRQTILYRGNVWRFAAHLNRMYVYGARHQKQSQARWDERACSGESLSLQCGFVSMFIHDHLSKHGADSRLVGCAKSSNWRHFDDGHALLEICDPVERRWVVYDPTLGARFRNSGRLLNLFELTRLYRSGKHPEHVEFLNASPKVDLQTDYEALYEPLIPDKSDLPAYVRQFKRLLENDAGAIHGWYAKVMQVPLIGNYFVPDSDAEDALFRTEPTWKNLVRLTPDEFQARFYNQPCDSAVHTSPAKSAVDTPTAPSRN